MAIDGIYTQGWTVDGLWQGGALSGVSEAAARAAADTAWAEGGASLYFDYPAILSSSGYRTVLFQWEAHLIKQESTRNISAIPAITGVAKTVRYYIFSSVASFQPFPPATFSNQDDTNVPTAGTWTLQDTDALTAAETTSDSPYTSSIDISTKPAYTAGDDEIIGYDIISDEIADWDFVHK